MSTPAAITALEETKQILDTSAETNRNLFIAFNSVLITLLTLCLSVTDEMLLLDSSIIGLPLLNIELPIGAFATIAPLALVALHFNLLQNIDVHREKLITWCHCWSIVHPSPSDNINMPKQLYPFMFDFAWVYENHISSKSMGMKLLPRLCWLLYSWLAYSVLVIFFVRFAEAQHYGYMLWHLFLLVCDALVLHWYWTGLSDQPKPTAWRFIIGIILIPFITPFLWLPQIKHKLALWRLKPAKLIFLCLSNMVALWTLVLFTLIQLHIDCNNLHPTIRNVLACNTKPKLVEWALNLEKHYSLNLVPRLSLRVFRIPLPNNFLALERLFENKKDFEIWQENKNKTLDLSGRRLAFADFGDAQLPHVALSGAQLQGAWLGNTNLQGVDFNGANLQGVDFHEAHLEAASLDGAHLEYANFQLANLQGSSLNGAYLEAANLGLANLEGASLNEADLEYAFLNDAHLEGASLNKAHLKYASLNKAHLQGADIENAQLTSAVLIQTSLKGVLVTMEGSPFAGSWLEKPDWETPCDFGTLKNQSWAKTEKVKSLLKDAEQRQQVNISPPLPKEPTPKDFNKTWLEQLCKDKDITKKMLTLLKNYNHSVPPLTKDARDHLNKQETCKPYRDLLPTEKNTSKTE